MFQQRIKDIVVALVLLKTLILTHLDCNMILWIKLNILIMQAHGSMGELSTLSNSAQS